MRQLWHRTRMSDYKCDNWGFNSYLRYFSFIAFITRQSLATSNASHQYVKNRVQYEEKNLLTIGYMCLIRASVTCYLLLVCLFLLV